MEPGSGEDGPEVPLVGDGVTQGIVRVGATVQSYLAHLRREGFTAAPEPLGADARGREVLSFVPGWVPRGPLPPQVSGAQVLRGLGELIARLHAAARTWTVPEDAVWGGIPGAQTVAVPPVDRPAELVGHRDYCPGNVVFRQGLSAALIDFDLAGPTSRAYELANAGFWWVPLWDPVDRPEGFADLDAGPRLRALLEGYGADRALRERVVEVAVAMVARFRVTTAEAARRDDAFARMVAAGALERSARAQTWLEEQAPRLREAVTAGLPGAR